MLYNLFENRDFVSVFAVALLAEGVDRNHRLQLGNVQHRSPSSQRAWIEMPRASSGTPTKTVALLAEGVDRNFSDLKTVAFSGVALLAEGVDRNLKQKGFKVDEESVALLAEGVDRNRKPARPLYGLTPSPSSQRAWIEILRGPRGAATSAVALLAEGVDRNRSGSATTATTRVALLAEGVDRNAQSTGTLVIALGRPPRRGRG